MGVNVENHLQGLPKIFRMEDRTSMGGQFWSLYKWGQGQRFTELYLSLSVDRGSVRSLVRPVSCSDMSAASDAMVGTSR